MFWIMKANEAMDNNDDEFFNNNGERVIESCFRGVLTQNQNHICYADQNRGFKQIVTNVLGNFFEWPNNNYFSNAFRYLFEQYTDNVKTNLKTHCERRLKKFFKMRVYELNDNILRRNPPNPVLFDGNDIKNAVNYTYNARDSTRGDVGAQQRLGVLLAELRTVGAPRDCNIKEFVENNWFKSIRMWINIQRDIHYFHLAYSNLQQSWNFFKRAPLNVTRPTRPEPPEITNFAAIPICRFQRRHIKIDTTVLYNILCSIKKVPQKIGMTTKTGKVKFRNIEQNDFLKNKPDSWNLFFDMDKINRLVKYKKQFGNSIVTDGVSCSVLFEQPQEQAAELDNEELRRRYEAGRFFYELGIDPGMRTWNATVRRNIRTGEEVTFENYEVIDLRIF